jgi:exodeoxyribonuclease VII small subunit
MAKIIEIEPEQPQPEEISYEEALAELEKIVTSLESDQSSLEESLALFERGRALVQRCGELLQAAELQLSTLLPGLDESPDLDEEDEA